MQDAGELPRVQRVDRAGPVRYLNESGEISFLSFRRRFDPIVGQKWFESDVRCHVRTGFEPLVPQNILFDVMRTGIRWKKSRSDPNAVKNRPYIFAKVFEDHKDDYIQFSDFALRIQDPHIMLRRRELDAGRLIRGRTMLLHYQ
jgi:hypothetical protein